MAKEFLSELDFDTQYRQAKPEFYFDGIIYYHKVKYAEGYKAEEAGIHQTQAFDQTQFVLDAQHGLAYLPAGEIPEQPSSFDRQVTVDGIMKEGQVVETYSEDEQEIKKSKPKKSAAKKTAKQEVPSEQNDQQVEEQHN